MGGLESEGSQLGAAMLGVRIPQQSGGTRADSRHRTLPDLREEVGGRCGFLERGLKGLLGKPRFEREPAFCLSRSTQSSHEKKRLLMIIVHEQGKGKNGVGALPVLV